MNRHTSANNRAQAGEVGKFVESVRLWCNPVIEYVRMPDGKEFGKRPDYSQMTVVHTGQMTLDNAKKKNAELD